MADAVLAWFASHPGFAAARTVFVELLGAVLATRAEQWKQVWLLEGEQRGEPRGEQMGRRRGQADLLLRLLERRFGILPGWAKERVLAADSVKLEEWSLLVLDAANIEEVFA